ncbi:MAG: hypothetical protein V3V50_01970 [Gammaproteobacteria bacterium]
MSKSFILGDSYFMLSYLDRNYKFPIIISLVYLGKNLEEEREQDDLWFFQDSESYIRCGSYTGGGKDITQNSNNKDSSGGEVYDFPEAQLKDILTAEELANELHGII